MRLRNCGVAVAEQHCFKKLRNCDCRSVSFKLRNCDCGLKKKLRVPTSDKYSRWTAEVISLPLNDHWLGFCVILCLRQIVFHSKISQVLNISPDQERCSQRRAPRSYPPPTLKNQRWACCASSFLLHHNTNLGLQKRNCALCASNF